MSKSKIPSDATIEDVISTLKDAEEYVRGVLGNMHRAKKELGSGEVRVRIGTTGQGITPHYQVETIPNLTDEDLAKILSFAATSPDDSDDEKYFPAYHGSAHTLLDWDLTQIQYANWSSKYLAFNQVENLLGVLRGVHPAPPR